MTDLASNPAYLIIEDRLDEVGQRYRVQRLLRGAMLWIGFGATVSVGAAIAAHALGQGRAAMTLAIAWAAWLVGSAITWIIRPMLLRPRNVEIARLIETRIDGLHNGLTNCLLLARAADIQSNPMLSPIFEEVAQSAQSKPLDQTVKISDLKSLAQWMGGLVAVLLALAVVLHGQLAHGWQQMLAPGQFVPRVGALKILDVQPGNAMLVRGQALEITVSVEKPADLSAPPPEARVIFDGALPAANLATMPADENGLHFDYRLDHVEQSLRYRIEVGASQSPWFNVNVVAQVKLAGMSLTIRPPTYTKQAQTTISLGPDEIDKTPIIVPQGSVIEIGADTDVPAKTAMLQIGDGQPVEMRAGQGNQHFFQTLTILSDSTISIQLLEGRQIIAKLPENGLTIHTKPDAPPHIEMAWPNSESLTMAPTRDLKIQARITDDWGLSGARGLMGVGDAPMALVAEQGPIAGPTLALNVPIHLAADQARDGNVIHIQVEAMDNRNLREQMKAAGITDDDGGPQTARSASMEIQFADPAKPEAQQKEIADRLGIRLAEILKMQQDLLDQAASYKAGDGTLMGRINGGQTDVKDKLVDTADHFEFDAQTIVVKRTLQMLAANPASEAIDISASILTEPVAQQQLRLNVSLKTRQRVIISTLESLLATLNPAKDPTTKPSAGNDPLLSKADAYKKLDEAIKQYSKMQQRILDQTASLAKKPVDNYSEDDQKLLAELQMAQEKLDAFLQQAINDFSKNAQQDVSNSDLIKDLVQIESEVTMAKGALQSKAVEIAVPDEANGLEQAKELQSNIEKWLANAPDRQQWTQEDPPTKNDAPMPELPAELEDMVGKLMEQEEDLFQQMEDANANWQDSIDKGQGWDALDGPIADNSAKGITGNALPNNNEMQGRSGEGRNGQSQGEFVGDSAVGKGGRNTPSRLDPTPFEKGQVKDTSKDPVGGATGGGKLSGQGGQGLEGPVPPKLKEEMQRLAQKQAELRNNAERLNLQYQLGRYDNFKLQESTLLMRRVESDLQDNRYQNALRRRDIVLDSLQTSQMLLGGQIHVQLDTTPTPSGKTQRDIADAMKGQLPPAWSAALQEYYRKLSAQ